MVVGEIAQRVEKKIREFIKQELRVLLGLEAPKLSATVVASSQFSDKEVEALKALAQRVLNKDKGTSAPIVNAASVEPVKKPTVSVNATTVEQRAVKTKAAKEPKTPKAKKDKYIERVVNLPNGETKTIKINVSNSQVKPEGYIALTPQQIADQQTAMSQQQALNNTPTSGILGIAVQAAQAGMIKPYNDGE